MPLTPSTHTRRAVAAATAAVRPPRFRAEPWMLPTAAALAAALCGARASAQQATGAAVVAAAAAPADSAAPPAAAVAPTATALPAFLSSIQANAYVSLGYSYNANRPGTRRNGLRVFDQYDNTLGVDVAELVLQRAVARPGDAGFRVDLTAGTGSPQSGQAAGLSLGQNADLQQAFVSYVAPVGSGLRVDAGKFVTHVGYEVYDGYDGYDSQYTRSLLFNYAGPFTHTGAKASYTFSRHVSAMVGVLNGWDNAVDNNGGKSVGAQIVLTPAAPVAVYLNYMGGPEKTDTSGYRRNVYDVAASWQLRPGLTLGADGVYGTERGASLVEPGGDATWRGVAGYVTVSATPRLALGLRGESMRDAGGTRFGLGERATVSEITLTPTYKVSDRVVVRGDARIDRSSRPMFIREAGALRRQQATFAGNVIFVY
jgi:hypothetical protein